MKIEYLYEDDDYCVVFKPAGMPSQSGKGFARDVLSFILEKEALAGRELFASPINRLDTPVSGLMIVAKTSAMAAKLSGISYRKEYTAYACGRIEGEGELTDYLLKDPKTNSSRVVSKDVKGAKKASLTYQVIGHGRVLGCEVTKLKIVLKSGRHHQIRVQLANMGHALYGDRKYGQGIDEANVSLCATGLEFEDPNSGKMVRYDWGWKEDWFENYEEC